VIIFPVSLHGCETWSVRLTEWYEVRSSGKGRLPLRKFGSEYVQVTGAGHTVCPSGVQLDIRYTALGYSWTYGIPLWGTAGHTVYRSGEQLVIKTLKYCKDIKIKSSEQQ
jgi:hypothetical protein